MHACFSNHSLFVPRISCSLSRVLSRLLSAFMSALLGLALFVHHKAPHLILILHRLFAMDKVRKITLKCAWKHTQAPHYPYVILYLPLFGTIAPSCFHLFLIHCDVFATRHSVNLNVCHLWFCFTQVNLLEVKGSHLKSCHVMEEVHKMFHQSPYPSNRLTWGIFQGHTEQHSYSCMVVKCKRLPIGLWQQQRFLSLPDFRPCFRTLFYWLCRMAV